MWAAMNNVRFTEGAATFSYGAFYEGFGLSITCFQLFAAFLAWLLGSMAERGISETRVIAWGMFTLQASGVVLSLRYFSTGPAVLSVVAALCFLAGAISLRRSAVGSR